MSDRSAPTPSNTPQARRGAVLVAVLVCLLIAALVTVAVIRHVILHYRQLRWAQAEFLAQAGLARGALQVRRSPEYTGESWQVPAEHLSVEQAGLVIIRVEASSTSTDRRWVRVEAHFPDHATTRARCTKQIEISLPSGEPQS